MTLQKYYERLAYAKWLFLRSRAEVKKGGIAAEFSVLGFHDCVELVLLTMADIKSINLPSHVEFLDYWSKFEGKQVQLTMKNSMKRLNTARKSLKHLGSLPGIEMAKECMLITEEFLRNTCLEILSIEWDSISLADLIKSDSVRELIKQAERYYLDQKYIDTVIECGNAFEKAMDEFYGKVEGTNSPYYMGRNPELYPQFANVSDKISAATPIRDMPMQFNRVSNAVAVLCLGLEYDKYARFMNLVFQAKPCILESPSSNPSKNDDKAGERNATYCLDFVIDALILLQDKASL